MIKIDIEMPLRCAVCPCYDEFNTMCNLDFVIELKREDTYFKRHYNCPLIAEQNKNSCNNCKHENEPESPQCQTCEPPGYGTNWEWEESE